MLSRPDGDLELPAHGSGGRMRLWYWKPGFQRAYELASDVVAARETGDEVTVGEHLALVSEGYCPTCRWHRRLSRLTRTRQVRMLPEGHPTSVVRTFAGCERECCDWYWLLTSELGHLPVMLATSDIEPGVDTGRR